MSIEYVIGMDCGTTNIKAAALGSDGRVAAEESLPSRFLNPGRGMQEQSAADWWENAAALFRSLAEQLGPERTARIRGVMVSSHTVSLLPVDEAGEPLRNVMTYQDGRSAAELAEIVRRIGRERYVQLAGGQPSVAFLPGKLLWFLRNEPDLYARTAWFAQASSYINFKLTGVPSCDADQASRTQCADISRMAWSEELCGAIGPDVLGKLPPIYAVDAVLGTVTGTAANETGLPAGVPVLASCSDAMAAMLAIGMSALGEAGESSGTTSLLFIGSAVQSPPDVPVVTRPSPVPGMPWVFDAPIQSSGAALRWYIDTMAAEERAEAERRGMDIYDYLGELALQAPPGSHGLFFLPYLLGERAPLWNDYCSGMFIGLRMDTSRSDMIRAVFEGTAYALRHVAETVRKSGGTIERLRICGGGAKNHVWNRIKAAVLGVPVQVLSSDSGDVPVGDALLAGHAAGLFPDLAEASRKVIRIRETVEPDPAWSAVYDKLYPFYIELYQKLDGTLERLKETVESL